MIVKAIEELAQALCEVSPSGGCGGVQVLLPDEQWKALEIEMRATVMESRLYVPPRDRAEPTEPVCVRIYTLGGEVTIRRAP